VQSRVNPGKGVMKNAVRKPSNHQKRTTTFVRQQSRCVCNYGNDQALHSQRHKASAENDKRPHHHTICLRSMSCECNYWAHQECQATVSETRSNRRCA